MLHPHITKLSYPLCHLLAYRAVAQAGADVIAAEHSLGGGYIYTFKPLEGDRAIDEYRVRVDVRAQR